VEDRGRCIELVEQARASGARRVACCEVLEVSLRTVESLGERSRPGRSATGAEERVWACAQRERETSHCGSVQ
jgi:hypothetical protein